jgi:SAM-dependent methyltransferase
MSFYERYVLPRCIDFSLSRPPVLRARARVLRGLYGEVLEIGFGSGLNLPFYPAEVTCVYAIDPSEGARKLAEPRLDRSPVQVEWSELDGQELALPTESIDCALSTFTLCTIADLPHALAEIRRVLKPRGLLHFLEHGRSPEHRIARWQDRLTPLQRRVAGGCHLNRPVADQLRAAGFCIDALDNYHLPGPKVMTYLYEGRARACKDGPC